MFSPVLPYTLWLFWYPLLFCWDGYDVDDVWLGYWLDKYPAFVFGLSSDEGEGDRARERKIWERVVNTQTNQKKYCVLVTIFGNMAKTYLELFTEPLLLLFPTGMLCTEPVLADPPTLDTLLELFTPLTELFVCCC